MSKGALMDGTGSPERPGFRHLSRWIRWAIFLVVAFVGLSIRLPQLGARPMHTDEAVNAYILGQILAGRPFVYDPQDRHGPALAALALPLAKLQGARRFSELTESDVRLAAVVAGSVTILLLGAAVEMCGLVPCLIAALLFAIAPLPVYYDRYFIHESVFVAATLGLLLAGWGAWERRSTGLAALAGACAALMLAGKETALLHFFVLAGAGFLFWRWNLRGRPVNSVGRISQVLIAALTFLLVTVMLFSWFGANWKGPAGMLRAVPDFLARAHGDGHQEPVWFYLRLLTRDWSGRILVSLAGLGLFLASRKRSASLDGFLAFYGLLIAAAYSLIPYKTPWLALNLWLPIALFAGIAFESLWRRAEQASTLPRRSFRIASLLLGAILATTIVHDTRQRVFVHPAEESNPYAYAHTSEDLLGLPAEIKRLADQDGIAAPRIAVIAADPWPLPWYLRHTAEVGFWQPGQQPGKVDFYITSTEAADLYAERLQDFRPQFFGVRPGVLILLWSPAPR